MSARRTIVQNFASRVISKMAETTYKKREGFLRLSQDGKILSWTPRSPPDAAPELTTVVADIANLQQTPPDKPKVMMKVFVKSDKSVEPLVYVFTFSSHNEARTQADSLRDSLSTAIQAAKAVSSNAIIMGQQDQAVSRPSNQLDSIYSDDQLWNNFDLLQDLLQDNTALSRTWTEARKSKPDTITDTQFNKQFWSSRLGLLRAHAIQRTQRTGDYNVLSVIKPRVEDSQIKLNISGDQLTMLLRQYAVVRRAYDENVPPLQEQAFWSRFFTSRLLKKLKGERITDADPKDSVFDKYLSQDNSARLEERISEARVPHTIDLQGNEENHPQRRGNAPDLLMRPTSVEKVPIIRTLNAMSEQLMSQVAPNDIDPSQPIGVDEETFNQLALRDLQGDAAENRLILNVKDQGRFFASGKDTQSDLNLLTSTKTTPSLLLQKLQKSLVTERQGLSIHDLTPSLGLDADSDSDSDDQSGIESKHFSSHHALRSARKQVFGLIKEQRAQNEDTNAAGTNPGNTPLTLIAPKSGLSVEILDRLALTHATTIEFLHYFWSTFLSGDPSRAEEIASLAITLDRANQRIEAVATDAESEREIEVTKLRKAAAERGRRLGKPPVAIDETAIKGGRKAVMRLMEPTINSISTALRKYKEARLSSELENGA